MNMISCAGRIIGAAALLAAATSASACQTTPQQTADQEIVRRLDAAFSDIEAKGFTGIVAVAKDGEIIFDAGAGYADPASRRDFGLDTLVGIGSITKTFTGMAASELMARGAISPEDTIASYFPDAPGDKAGITLHQLLTHSAGFPGAVGDDYQRVSRAEFLENAWNADLLFEPGSGYSYSNVGFSIVAAVIELVTGQSYEDFLVDDLLLPAGLTHTGYVRAYDPDRIIFNDAGMEFADASWGGPAPHWNLIGNGGLISTPRDIVDMMTHYAAGGIVSAQAANLARQPYVLEGEGAPSSYGYGIVVEDDPHFGRVYWHNGGNPYFNSHVREFPSAGFVVFAFANQERINGDKAVRAMAGAIFDVPVNIHARAEPGEIAGPVEIPDTPAGRVIAAFFDAIGENDPDAWRSFVENHTTAEFQAFAPMDGHLDMFSQMHADFGGGDIIGVERTDGGALVRVREPASGMIIFVEMPLEEVDGTLLLAGLGIDSE